MESCSTRPLVAKCGKGWGLRVLAVNPIHIGCPEAVNRWRDEEQNRVLLDAFPSVRRYHFATLGSHSSRRCRLTLEACYKLTPPQIPAT